MVGRGATYADIDGDGDIDLLMIANGGPARLLRNDQTTNNGWLRVKLKDKSNTGAIGALVTIPILEDGKEVEKLVRCITATRSYLSQSELTATFGLGSRKPTEMRVRWPDGSEQTVPIEAINKTVVVEQAP